MHLNLYFKNMKSYQAKILVLNINEPINPVLLSEYDIVYAINHRTKQVIQHKNKILDKQISNQIIDITPIKETSDE